jgi:hypothetical protein
MSIFYYYISYRPLPEEVIERAHSMHYSIDNATKYVKDPIANHYYYSCDPVSIYTSKDYRVKGHAIEEIFSKRNSIESNFLLWTAVEFNKLGDFKFIRMLEDGSRCDTGFFESFFESCIHEPITYMDFSWSLASYERGLETDVLYLVHGSNT